MCGGGYGVVYLWQEVSNELNNEACETKRKNLTALTDKLLAAAQVDRQHTKCIIYFADVSTTSVVAGDMAYMEEGVDGDYTQRGRSGTW